jgi:hypothetical protein
LHIDKDQGLSSWMPSFCAIWPKQSKYKPIKNAGQNRIFSPLGIEARFIENLLSQGLEDDALCFNKRKVP